METSFDSLHHQVFEILPWYVRGTLEATEAARVKAHLSDCPICRGEAEGLSRMFRVHEASSPQAEVQEDRLQRLLVRIDSCPQHRRHPERTRRNSPLAALRALVSTVLGYLATRPTLTATAASAVLVLCLLAQTVPQVASDDPRYDVLSSSEAAAELRVVLRFHAAATLGEVQRLVASSLDQDTPDQAYRIERRGEREYLVVLRRRPGVAEVARLLKDWRATAQVADASIDGG